MNWSRVRWLLIVCLCLTDLVLGVLLWQQYRGENTVSRAAVEDTADLLAQCGISLSPDVVPAAVVKDYVYRIPTSEDAYLSAFSTMVGTDISGVYMLPLTGGTSVVFENGDHAEYYHNLYLSYTKGSDDSWEEIADAYRAGEDGFAVVSGSDAHAAAETAELFLSSMTAGEANGVWLRPGMDHVYKTPVDSVYLVVFTEEILRGNRRSAADIYGTQVCVLVEGDIVWHLSGTWVPFLPDEIYSTKKLDQLNILFSERKRHIEMTNAGGDASDTQHGVHEDGGCTIISMERCYYMLWDDAGTLYLRPAWLMGYRLQDEDGAEIAREVLCDGVTGNVVLQTDTTIQ